MAARGNGGTDWSILIAGAALTLTFAGGIWSLVNPKGDTERIEKRLQIIEDALQWKYPSKELLAKDIEYLRAAASQLEKNKIDRDVYEQKMSSIDNSIRIQRERTKDLEHSVNITYSAKDALLQL